MTKILLHVVLPLLLLLGGGAVSAAMVAMRPVAERKPVEPKPVPVEVVVAAPETAVARVPATGTVTAAQQVNLVAEVSGRVVYVHPNLLLGGRFAKGTTLVRLDPRDYEAAVEAERARLRQAELELELERGRGEAAKREWALLGDGRPDDRAALALRRTQLAVAEQNVAAAKASLLRAENNLARTEVKAPFNAMVVAEQAELGQVAGPGAPIATLVGTDRFFVAAQVPVEKLDAIEIAGVNSERASAAVVIQPLGAGKALTRVGHVAQLGGQLDPATRTATVLVAIDDPLDPEEGGLPLLPGAFVDIEFAGRALQEVVPVPRVAVVDGSAVWVVGEGAKLSRRALEIAWREDQRVFALSGLNAGDRIVTTPLALPVEGMAVEVRSAPSGS